MRSLQAKLTILFFAVVLVATALVGAIFYRGSTQLVNEMIGTQAVAIAERARAAIDAEALAEVIATGEENEAYARMRSTLNEIRAANGLKYLYTMGMTERDGERVYFYAVDGMPEGSEDASALGEIEPEPDSGVEALFATGEPQLGTLDYTEEYGATLTAYLPVKDSAGKLIATVGADFDASRIYALQADNRRNAVLICAGLLLAALVAAYLLARVLTRPLARLTALVEQAGQGDLTVRAELGRKDEIGQLAVSFQRMMDNLRAFADIVQRNTRLLERSVDKLRLSAADTSDRSGRIAGSMREVASAADAELQRAADTATSLEEVAAGIARVAAASSEVAEASGRARTEAENGSALSHEVIVQMETIQSANEQARRSVTAMHEHARHIDEIVDTIGAIATQTNILALNAGIEASRAGEHGRGFAVVAGEIRQLAEQTARSSARIAEMIAATQSETEKAVASMERAAAQVQRGNALAAQAGGAFEVILREVRRVDGQIVEVSAAAEQLAAGTEEVAASVDEAAKVTERSVAFFRETAASAEEQLVRVGGLQEEAETLSRMAGDLGGHVRRFKVQ